MNIVSKARARSDKMQADNETRAKREEEVGGGREKERKNTRGRKRVRNGYECEYEYAYGYECGYERERECEDEDEDVAGAVCLHSFASASVIDVIVGFACRLSIIALRIAFSAFGYSCISTYTARTQPIDLCQTTLPGK